MKVIHFKTITSTNTYIKDNYKELDNLTFVYADEQSEGHGRYGRIWKSNPGENILASLLIKEDINENNPAIISLVCAHLIHKVLSKYISNLTIKWPNDILYNGKKICGILCEGISSSEKIEALIVGFGINCNQCGFDESLNATSIKEILNKEVNLIELLEELIVELKNVCTTNITQSISYTNKFLYMKNKDVFFTYQNKECSGKIIQIENDGKLFIQMNDEYVSLDSGEIKIKR